MFQQLVNEQQNIDITQESINRLQETDLSYHTLKIVNQNNPNEQLMDAIRRIVDQSIDRFTNNFNNRLANFDNNINNRFENIDNNINNLNNRLENIDNNINIIKNNLTILNNNIVNSVNSTNNNLAIINNNLRTIDNNHNIRSAIIFFNNQNEYKRGSNAKSKNPLQGLHKTIAGFGVQQPWYSNNYQVHNFGLNNIGNIPVNVDFRNRDHTDLVISRLSYWYNETFDIEEEDDRDEKNNKFFVWLTKSLVSDLPPQVNLEPLIPTPPFAELIAHIPLDNQ
ncbi:hypothetical protein PPL_06579 [Heterostelium album PN500]|uniref:Uncharacterized protein n=1 Tax=Heterostelium pallidum (strain ATCC 26659 / Pp 5 / PN500) TaxID=670386 RepID=D3BF46_HETP5|nr:hypothetical protein PPL_06579 [Heterostelium album PN500]EFA79760.1 hypothetical protein PPL_06579 [Heterostelium album PN500]|eukprot:XP_020431881.1 hypothetical protein PPL_06579 [Heterostelium album PN500]